MEFKTSGFVLKKQNFGEADRILKVLSEEFGLISVLAKGVKKMKSRKAGSLELFCESKFRLHRKTGELFLITETAPISSLENSSLEMLKPAFEAAELLLTLAPPEKPLPRIYKLFQEFLTLLPRTEKLQLLKIAFFTKALSIFGFFPDLSKFEGNEKKFFKFLITEDLPQILRLANEETLFAKAETFLANLFERESDKLSKVVSSTQDWN